MKIKPALFFIPLLMVSFASAQQNQLDNYIDSALAHNIVIQQKNISLQKAVLGLAIAKSYYMPSVAFEAGYQTADGGRQIQLPIGDLLNGVYGTLNQLTGSNRFPQLENQVINFLPSNFYDAKIHAVMPVIDAEIGYRKKITDQQIALSALDIAVYKRTLIRDVKTAYYNYLAATAAIQIHAQSLVLAEEGKRVNQSLLDNGKGLPAYVMRSESEVEQAKAQLSTARQQANNAKIYFNFLLNRPQQSLIDSNFNAMEQLSAVIPLLTREEDGAKREELVASKQLVAIHKTTVQLNRSAFYPKLNSFLDVGSQSENWKFNSESRYYMLGLQLAVPIFLGNRTKNQVRQAQLDMDQAKLNVAQTQQQLSMAAKAAQNNLLAAWETLQSTKKQLEAAAAYQRLIDRGYRAGVNTFLETIDARNQFAQARIAENIQEYKVLSAAADFEREAAIEPLKK
ncbi:transporter [Niabella ginsenosidivorans]|uniref:Transporter n=2 Tax=Niabella ginsenosidivorans TaxID=1176587 RepID=A0A1A9I812_9BACT|nr:transporter [Niabella ginsenosidivorans]